MPNLPTRPSKNLAWFELACKDGTPYPEKWRSSRALKLGVVFEIIRAAFGNKPIVVLSGYRTPSWNRKIGGARNSQHVEGRALDLRPPNGVNPKAFYEVIKQFALETDIRGIGLYKTFVHVDIRPQTHLTVWKGSGVKDSLNI